MGADSDVCLFMTDDAGSISDSASMTTIDTGKRQALRGFLGGATPKGSDLLVAGLELTKAIVPGQLDEFTGIPQIGLAHRVAFNPMTAVNFESVDVRTFSFSYIFVPESVTESFLATQISNWFRRYLYPKKAGNFSLKYPPRFRIDFMIGDKLNPWYPVYYDSFITGVDVKMNPNGRAFFPDGSPTSIGLDLSFQETKQLTRDKLYHDKSLYPNMTTDGMRPEYPPVSDEMKEMAGDIGDTAAGLADQVNNK
jgi:hypothetical protein